MVQAMKGAGGIWKEQEQGSVQEGNIDGNTTCMHTL